MFCPNCKAEYREGFTRCASCDKALVSSLLTVESGASQHERAWNERAAVLWSGQDPVTFSVILNALNAAEIPYREWQSRDVTAALSRPLALGFYGIPHWEVRVHPDNLAAGCAAVQEAIRPLSPFAVEDKVVVVEKGAVEFKAADDNEGSATYSSRVALAPVEVWSGQDATRAQFFRGSLLENHISCWALTASNGGARLLVAPNDVARAGEIIREILESSSAA